MNIETLRKRVVCDIRSSLISCKKKELTLKELESAYKELIFCTIPFEQFGHNTLVEFLTSVDSLQVRKTSDGTILVKAKENPLSVHISKMIAKDKSKKRTNIKCFTKKAPRDQTHLQSPKKPKTTRKRQRPLTKETQLSDHLKPQLKQSTQNDRCTSSSTNRLQTSSQPQRPASAFNNKNHEPIITPMAILPVMHQVSSEKSNLSAIMQRAVYSERSNLSKIMNNVSDMISCVSLKETNAPSTTNSKFISQEFHQPVQYINDGDIKNDLLGFLQFRGMNKPSINVYQMNSKSDKKTVFYCKIKVDDMTFSSYPEEYSDKESAINHASKTALEALINKYCNNNFFSK